VLWKSRTPNKCRFFVWLAFLRRCWTADRRFRRGLQSDNSCALCLQEPELVDHLILQCVFSCVVWFSILRHCGWQLLAPTAEDSLASWWVLRQKQVVKERKKAFDLLVILIVWSIWLERNNRCFTRGCKTAEAVVDDIGNLADL
jgi:hypothetical protein